MAKVKNFLKLTIFSHLLLWHVAVTAELPNLGSEFRNVLSLADEKVLGEAWMKQLRSEEMVHPDLLANAYIRMVGQRLTPYADTPDYPIKFFVVNSNSVNAFAFLGGHIGVHSGLILLTQTESELAAVMAHELGHISQQHILRQIAQNRRLLPLTIAEALAAVMLGVPDLIVPVLAGHGQKMLNFSRQNEQEADRIGMQILSKSQFDPQGMANIFERMQANGRHETVMPEYLLTHPIYESRISDTRHRAQQFQYQQHGSTKFFDLVRMRLMVQAAPDLDQLAETYRYQLESMRYADYGVMQYAYGYALYKQGKLLLAKQELEKLATDYKDDMVIQLSLMEVELGLSDVAAAKSRIERVYKKYPNSFPVIAMYSEILIQEKQSQTALSILKKAQPLHAQEPMIYELLRQVAGMQNDWVSVYEANAEWFVLHGDYSSALGQLDYVLTKSEDHKVKSRVQQRKNSVQALLKSQKAVL